MCSAKVARRDNDNLPRFPSNGALTTSHAAHAQAGSADPSFELCYARKPAATLLLPQAQLKVALSLAKHCLSRISRYAPQRLEISSPPPFDDDDEFRQDASSPAHTFTMAAVYENLSSDLVWQISRTLPTTENTPARN